MNYQKICQSLFVNLNLRQKEVIFRRFGLDGKERQTLEAIGQNMGLTRERVRQIAQVALVKIKESQIPAEVKKALSDFKRYLQNNGGLKREDLLFAQPSLGGGQPDSANWINFLLTSGESFIRIGEAKDFYPFWAIDQKTVQDAGKTMANVQRILEKGKKQIAFNDLVSLISPAPKTQFLKSIMETSKEVLKTTEGKYGLKIWPEVNPRGVKDLALVVLRKLKKPLHFVQIAEKIDEVLGMGVDEFSVISASFPAKKTNCQTVHNELIKNPQFILVGRGMYALREWGYEPGTVQDVISRVLKDAKKPLKQDEVLKKVLSQRLVKESTILLNLGNKKCFLKSSDGKYSLREA